MRTIIKGTIEVIIRIEATMIIEDEDDDDDDDDDDDVIRV